MLNWVQAAILTFQIGWQCQFTNTGGEKKSKIHYPVGTASFIAIKIHYRTYNMIVDFHPDHEILMVYIKI